MWFRPEVLALPSYVPGKKPSDPSIIKLASNETPFPTLPQVEAAIAGAAGNLNRYPDMFATDLVADLAAFHEWPDAGIVVGNGSTALIEKFLQAVVDPEGEVVLPWRSFEAYPIAIQAAGGIGVQVPLTREGAHDLRGMLKAITPRTRAILVCSPNNPTGVAITHTEFGAAFLSEVPVEIPVLLDEAYINFVDMPDRVDSLALLRQHRNLIVLRTFSKAYGMAGMSMRVRARPCGHGGGVARYRDSLRRKRSGSGGGSGGAGLTAAGQPTGGFRVGGARSGCLRSGRSGLERARESIELLVVRVRGSEQALRRAVRRSGYHCAPVRKRGSARDDCRARRLRPPHAGA